MKTFRLISIILVVLASCKGNDQSKPTGDNVLVPIKTAFNISSLPQDWVRLTKTDSGMIIFNSCDAGNLLLSITKNNNQPCILLHGQQEDDEYIILNSLLNGDTVVVKTQWKGTKTLQDFKFIWKDKSRKLGRWITTFPTGYTSDLIFVTSDKTSQFKTINQPCRECWGDECDEIEKKDSAAVKKDSL